MYPWNHERRFNAYPQYFKKTFGQRVQKVSIDAGFSCPNRDGTVAYGSHFVSDIIGNITTRFGIPLKPLLVIKNKVSISIGFGVMSKNGSNSKMTGIMPTNRPVMM